MNDPSPITAYEQIAFDIYHADDAYHHFAKMCYPTTNWEISGPEPNKQNYVIGYSISVPDIYNEMHDVNLLVHAVDEEGCDDACAVFILDYINDYEKEQWLLERNPNNWSTIDDEKAYLDKLSDEQKEITE